MKKKLLILVTLLLALVCLFFISINLGSIKVSFSELIKGLFIEYNEKVATIYDLRFPRIIIAIFAGAGLAVSGVLFQAVMKNPLSDPGIIGISSGANFVMLLIGLCFPSLYFSSKLFAFLGGVLAFILVYMLSWKNGLNPLRIILVGIAVNAVFTGFIDVINNFSSSSLLSTTITMKTWNDVHSFIWYVIVALIAACFVAGKCNLLMLEDRTVRSLGVNVNYIRFIISLIAVLLASLATSVVGVISFVGLIVPHISRLLIGSDHKVLIPFSALLGGFILLLADTVGRTIIAPYEIAPSIIMAIVGGPFFIILLRRSDKKYGN